MIKNIFKALLCPCHHRFEDVVLYDQIWDRETDNDDLEDSPTLIRVSYCPDCGKVFNIKAEPCQTSISPLCEIDRFEQITGIDHRTVTLYKEPKKLRDFRDIYG